MFLHSLFDALALLAALALYRWGPTVSASAPPWQTQPYYIPVATLGASLGAYLLGSLNLALTGIDGLSRSIEGALLGAILAIEALKAVRGQRGSTGVRFVAPLALAIAVGRIGCFLAGLGDMTYGTPTSLPWAHDFGDGVPRHPVQLYESLTMAVFLLVFLYLVRRRSPLALSAGFYLFIGVYAGQRFLWEFLKPYGTIVGPLNLFHIVSLWLIAYAFLFGRRELLACSTRATSAPLRA
jgi:prolipoprotein diacylglyceryltransferase